MMMKTPVLTAAVMAVLLGSSVAAQKTSITGAGATFPDPIYEKWFSEYNKLHPDVQINYQPNGSG
jgi:phosphate transport system substrate-binding protein